MANYIITVNRNLSHAGIKGMKWGRRRFQNEDGSLTEAGRKRYGVGGSSDDPHKQLERAQRMQDNIMRDINKRTGPDGKLNMSPSERKSIEEAWDKAVEQEISAKSKIKENTKRIDDAMGVDTNPNAAKAYKESLKKNQGPNDEPKPNGLVPYTKLTKRDEPDSEDKTESAKPGDDGYEIHKAPKSETGSNDTSKSKPKDIYDTDFDDKTSEKQSKSGKTKTEKEAEEAHKRGEERKKEAEKNRKEEEAEKKKNATERERSKQEREKEAEEAHERGEERKKEAEKNRKEEEAEKNKKEESVDYKRQLDTLKMVSDVSKDARTISNEIAGISERSRVNVPRLNLSGMTNEQMQKAIQRELIEKQYDNLFNTTRKQAEDRKQRTTDLLKNIGAAVTIVGGAVSIAERIYRWRKG